MGGDGGGLRHTLGRLEPKYNVTNMHLQGVKGKVVRSQGVNLITSVSFIYRVAADKHLESRELEVRMLLWTLHISTDFEGYVTYDTTFHLGVSGLQ